jgi:hypothetical protein
MTDKNNDLVFRTNGEEKFRFSGDGPWKSQTPTKKLEVTTQLSPAALAVMDAVVKVYPAFPDEVAAAAIRAAADQVVPVPITAKTTEEHWTKLGIKNQLLAIADELEGQ